MLLQNLNSGQSEPGSVGNKEVLHTPQSSRTRSSPSDCLMSYLGHSLEMGGGLNSLQRCSRCILQNQPTGQTSMLCQVWCH